MNKIHARHIEEAINKFRVNFDQRGYFNVFWHPERNRTVEVLAESSQGALEIAKYHFCRSAQNFKLLKEGKKIN